ncbi:hypothetical protein IFM89_033607 [Coptis chinensis]|uniref:Uncharacterized protein n=1 Tax=Coptis chinensis TaxID=261450 RepID=A0A835LX75_9MAGN|nr:hypothetical protein IFM89_033607 [Coptis chinensis]
MSLSWVGKLLENNCHPLKECLGNTSFPHTILHQFRFSLFFLRSWSAEKFISLRVDEMSSHSILRRACSQAYLQYMHFVLKVAAAKPDTHGSGKSRSMDPTDKFCNNCNREGHDESSCFQLHGFPEWWGDRPRGSKGPGRGGGRTGRGGGRAGSGRGRGYGAPYVHPNKTGGSRNFTGKQSNAPQGWRIAKARGSCGCLSNATAANS